jgi:leucyl/phenylalanyl-tRNA--protein transferase
MVLFPDEFKISHSLRRVLRKHVFTVTIDEAFGDVIRACARTRMQTWITDEMIDAYTCLYELGYAHSFETWQAGRLVGGLYGVALGRVFFGESMFSTMSDASKVALVRLVQFAINAGVEFIDCQTTTEHLKRLGAREVPRPEFLDRLRRAHPVRIEQ